MEHLILVRKNAYYDSVTLMTLSNKLKKMEGIQDAVVAMGTDMNKEQLRSVELSSGETDAAAAGDLIIAVKGEDAGRCEDACRQVDELLKNRTGKKGKTEESYPTIRAAKRDNEDLNFAVISVAGKYAAREARMALEQGMHVMLFSDNVTVEQEVRLKTLAHEKGLLVMGPDCGTAIINGIGLCFANAVNRGGIGLAAASGTGLQEAAVLIDRLGGGISQAIGTGGRDLSAEVGGIMMLDSLKLLEEDPQTQVIVLISKPPVKSVAEHILAQVAACKKPVVVCFIDGGEELLTGSGAVYAANLEHAATQAVRLLKKEKPEKFEHTRFPLPYGKIAQKSAALAGEQKYIRGLFCGGTLAAEALGCLSEETMEYYSNVSKQPEHRMADLMESRAHTIVDLGDDCFTVGRPHPMIEPELRVERMLLEARDPETAVLLVDFELGYGSHGDPVGVTMDALIQIRESRPRLAVVAYVLGTDKDWQGMAAQREMLEQAGVIVADSNRQAAEIALHIALRKGDR